MSNLVHPGVADKVGVALDGAMNRPLAIDLYTGLHGWAEGLIAAGWHVIGFDLHDMSRKLGEPLPDGHFALVIQDVLTLHGAQFKDAELIVGSSPCQEFSYRAMPWKRAKALGPPELGMKLFHAQFRIQREASEAARRHIPMVVENVRGAQPWVGRARWNFGSYYLWGDVPALMPPTHNRLKGGQTNWRDHDKPGYRGVQLQDHFTKLPGFRFDGSGGSFQTASVAEHVKGSEGYERNHPNALGWKVPNTWSKSPARKAASAKIAKIPLTLAEWVGRAWLPIEEAA